MGMTISAKGNIDNVKDIQLAVDDLKSIAMSKNWTYTIIDDDFDIKPSAVITQMDSGEPGVNIEGTLGLKGIILYLETDVEPLSILFDHSGNLTDMLQQLSWLDDQEEEERFTICKTQFGSVDTHIYIIELLEHLKKKYVSDLIVNDEGGYWDNHDRKLLIEKRKVLDYHMDHTAKTLSNIDCPGDARHDPEKLLSLVEKALAHEESGTCH
ncbi:MAG: hypothetical protein GY847_33225 [Proteobacteria bacterium]|nr:hypothetical protein [Pseudomonadota bacterium]